MRYQDLAVFLSVRYSIEPGSACYAFREFQLNRPDRCRSLFQAPCRIHHQRPTRSAYRWAPIRFLLKILSASKCYLALNRVRMELFLLDLVRFSLFLPETLKVFDAGMAPLGISSFDRGIVAMGAEERSIKRIFALYDRILKANLFLTSGSTSLFNSSSSSVDNFDSSVSMSTSSYSFKSLPNNFVAIFGFRAPGLKKNTNKTFSFIFLIHHENKKITEAAVEYFLGMDIVLG